MGMLLKKTKGIGAPDGKLDLFEFLIILDTICLLVAGILRLIVNSSENLNWDEKLINKSNYGCVNFDWNTDVFMMIDKFNLK